MKEITLTDLKQLEETALDTLNNINNEKIEAGFKEIKKLYVNEDIGVNIMHPYNKMIISKIFVIDKDIAIFEILTLKNKLNHITDIDSLYNFLKSFQKVLKSFRPTSTETKKQAYKNILNYMYKLLKYEYIRRVTKKIEDSKISTCVTTEDMRKKLLKDIKVNMQQYGYMTFILREKPHPKFGLFLSTNHNVRELLIKTLSKITQSLNASLNLIDSRSIKGEFIMRNIKRIVFAVSIVESVKNFV